MPILRISEFNWETRDGYEIDCEYDVDDFEEATGFLRWDLKMSASPAFTETVMREWMLSRGNLEIRNGISSRGLHFSYIP
jgi:hypothetical protein